MLDPIKQFRVEGPLGSGGSATVFKGVLLDQDLVNQHGTFDIALKKVAGKFSSFFFFFSFSSFLFELIFFAKFRTPEAF